MILTPKKTFDKGFAYCSEECASKRAAGLLVSGREDGE